jgi:hypothetical protein
MTVLICRWIETVPGLLGGADANRVNITLSTVPAGLASQAKNNGYFSVQCSLLHKYTAAAGDIRSQFPA